MDLGLPAATAQFAAEIERWSARRLAEPGLLSQDDPVAWKELVEFGLFEIAAAGGTDLDTAAGFMEAARSGLPGPLLEAELAVASGSGAATDALARGERVTSVAPGPAGAVVVGWGAVSSLVVEQGSGRVAATESLPPARMASSAVHGWLVREDSATQDALEARRWLLGAALLTGLGRGAMDLAVEHVKTREQFGRTLGSFPAVQDRLAECLNRLEGARLMVLDGAWRSSQQQRRDGEIAYGAARHTDTAAALAWLWASETAQIVSRHCHQVFGALGFCDEAGLGHLTSQLAWLRLSIGTRRAADLVLAERDPARPSPPSLVLQGFRGRS